MRSNKNFKNASLYLSIVAILVLFCIFSTRVYASDYVQQSVTVENDHAPLRIGGGSMFIASDFAERGEHFETLSHYVDESGKVWFAVNRGEKLLYISKNDCTIDNVMREIPEKQVRTIYLSPSRQPHNAYAVGDTNEMEQMEELCGILAELLREKYGFRVIKAPSYMRIIKSGRPFDAYTKNSDLYLAIHSNATAVSKKCSGAEAYYYPQSVQSRRLAENIVRELNAASDFSAENSLGAVSGMEAFEGFGYGEVRDTADYGMISVLAEVDYHDNPKTAQMIIDKKQRTAEAIARAVALTFLQKDGS